jgi:hypothetical protein
MYCPLLPGGLQLLRRALRLLLGGLQRLLQRIHLLLRVLQRLLEPRDLVRVALRLRLLELLPGDLHLSIGPIEPLLGLGVPLIRLVHAVRDLPGPRREIREALGFLAQSSGFQGHRPGGVAKLLGRLHGLAAALHLLGRSLGAIRLLAEVLGALLRLLDGLIDLVRWHAQAVGELVRTLLEVLRLLPGGVLLLRGLLEGLRGLLVSLPGLVLLGCSLGGLELLRGLRESVLRLFPLVVRLLESLGRLPSVVLELARLLPKALQARRLGVLLLGFVREALGDLLEPTERLLRPRVVGGHLTRLARLGDLSGLAFARLPGLAGLRGLVAARLAPKRGQFRSGQTARPAPVGPERGVGAARSVRTCQPAPAGDRTTSHDAAAHQALRQLVQGRVVEGDAPRRGDDAAVALLTVRPLPGDPEVVDEGVGVVAVVPEDVRPEELLDDRGLPQEVLAGLELVETLLQLPVLHRRVLGQDRPAPSALEHDAPGDGPAGLARLEHLLGQRRDDDGVLRLEGLLVEDGPAALEGQQPVALVLLTHVDAIRPEGFLPDALLRPVEDDPLSRAAAQRRQVRLRVRRLALEPERAGELGHGRVVLRIGDREAHRELAGDAGLHLEGLVHRLEALARERDLALPRRQGQLDGRRAHRGAVDRDLGRRQRLQLDLGLPAPARREDAEQGDDSQESAQRVARAPVHSAPPIRRPFCRASRSAPRLVPRGIRYPVRDARDALFRALRRCPAQF